MQTRILYLFTRTPLHVGSGASVGAIDQPIQRERHTGFPIIPASSLKGSFADHWNGTLENENADGKVKKIRGKSTAAWLFGSDDANASFAGSLLFSEARLLAFPIRSAKGSFAWISCPLILQKAARDGVFSAPEVMAEIKSLEETPDEKAIFKYTGPLSLGAEPGQIVLEDYCLTHSGQHYPAELGAALSRLVTDDVFTSSIRDRLVILSNGMMSHFAMTACEIAQHVRISDETGTAEGTGLFNQENVPGETLFYSVLHATEGRGSHFGDRAASSACDEFRTKVEQVKVFQFGGDASTGLGFCSVEMKDPILTP